MRDFPSNLFLSSVTWTVVLGNPWQLAATGAPWWRRKDMSNNATCCLQNIPPVHDVFILDCRIPSQVELA